MPDLYSQLVDELGDPDPTGPIPIVSADLISEYQAIPLVPGGVPVPQPVGVDDDLLRAMPRGYAALRPSDLALEQPPQDPDWRPDGDG